MNQMLAAVLAMTFCCLGVAETKATPKRTWPEQITISNKEKVEIYQPQVESLSQNKVTARAAFKLTRDGKDFYGSCKMEAQALINKDSDVVELNKIRIRNLQAPTANLAATDLQAAVEKKLDGKTLTVSYRSLVDNLAATENTNAKQPELKNTAPNFVFSSQPAILIMISGEPQWVESSGAKEVKRVLNSSALFLHQESSKDYYLWALGKWFQAPALKGPWQTSKPGPSSKYVMIKDNLVKEKKIDPLEGKTADGKSIFQPGVTPQIIIATKPTELLQSTGEPKYSSVEGTSLLYMSNSPNSIFVDSKDQSFFTLVSGRWFHSKSLQGPWDYVSAKKLPKDFAKIPVNSPVAEVLVSIPGTPQAKEAVVVSQIPQTAQVKRDLKPKDLSCDGAVQWQAMEGTKLKYAKNCNTPLIEVTDKSYYIVQDGVWFTSTSAKGPWQVALAVPAEIYKIPASSPLYYVTYVHVYGSTSDTVTVGYTPGYHGTFVSADGTIVYGTGYDYASYTSGGQWYPAPSTYGFGVGYGWGYEAGFFMGFSMGSLMYPWGWGSCCYGPTFVNINVNNTYTNWGRHTVISGPGGQGITTNTIGQTKFIRGNDQSNIYATHDGQVYRRTDNGWQKNVGPGSWENVEKKHTESLDRMHSSRETTRDVSRPPTGRDMSGRPQLQGGGGFRAGGFHGGGFRR
ncbi:carbohydrate-binding family V/XII [Bdellovibrio bacteriovorus]|uniref:carbohydrate-binding family V/XII n=1 Tax=Bdellovibrio bacteriovorus TaxID=959 RepID=UPI0035A597A0